MCGRQAPVGRSYCLLPTAYCLLRSHILVQAAGSINFQLVVPRADTRGGAARTAREAR